MWSLMPIDPTQHPLTDIDSRAATAFAALLCSACMNDQPDTLSKK